jgi:hypothetical protein
LASHSDGSLRYKRDVVVERMRWKL